MRSERGGISRLGRHNRGPLLGTLRDQRPHDVKNSAPADDIIVRGYVNALVKVFGDSSIVRRGRRRRLARVEVRAV